jgi:AraC family transcriptional regulator
MPDLFKQPFQKSAAIGAAVLTATAESPPMRRRHCAALDLHEPLSAKTLLEARRKLRVNDPIIETEAEWRNWACCREASGPVPRIVASRWHGLEDGKRETHAKTAVGNHVVKLVLRTMNLRLVIDGKCVHDGLATSGMLHITEPGALARGLFRGPYDTLHLHVSDALIDECLRDMPGRSKPPIAIGPGLISNPTVERLGRMLLTAGQHGDTLAPLYIDCVSIAIVARLLSDRQNNMNNQSGLATWRLKRTIDYIEAHLGEPISLADMAAAAGLTRMHFAAQFKTSTGLRPHEYLLRRRIERAQEMLLMAELAIVEIALSVGFQTQSHFTTTFVRFVGQTPRAWRLAQGTMRVRAR